MKQSRLAYLRLREDIVSLAVRPGDPLSESATAARLGISRTPVREAIQQLAKENLVNVIPDRGAFVAPFSLTDIVELFQMRQALEPFAMQLAANNPDVPAINNLAEELEGGRKMIESGDAPSYLAICSRMDSEISRMTRNGRLQATLSSIWQECRRMRALAGTNHARLLSTVDENKLILESLRVGDGDKAAALSRDHLAHSYDNILRSFGSNPS